ncbi:hypothetical protein Dsin_023614 [Dipteronia sinensis]|uniref:C2H2-type domain-containing protein n=1 Tax=Dipteronia sinensis TaxID=43782 RepID=A0AAE0E180_9ROSI|nr:hypothetical protein Dsin_023614 [Dipteronia sinensis]
MADQQHVQETQLGSSHEEEEEEDMMAYDDENNRRPVFDGLISSSSSLQLNISTNNNSVTVKREEAVAVDVAGGGVVGCVNGGMRICSECGKQFSSGKALGGHKRACLQSKNNRLKLKQPTIKIEVAVELGGGGGGGSGKSSSNVDQGVDHRCCVCDQRFLTVKSLYGHMRKHPERDWRGIHPPQHHQPLNQHHHHHLSGSSTLSNDHNDVVDGDNDDDVDVDVDERGGHVAVDLVESLKGWSVKDKRGRKSSSNNSEEVEADPVDKEAASNLFYLAQTLQDYRVFGGHYPNKKLKLELDRPDDHHHASSGYGVLKIKERMPAETDHHDRESREMEMEMDMMRNMKQQKKRKLTELEPNTYKFYCPICNKGFDKHQALGGHVASHNNKSKNLNLVNSMKESSASVEAEAAAAAEEESDDQQDSGGGPAGGDDDRSSRVNSELGGGDQLHQCNICSKNFPTGQALGGHKRCHWTGPGINFPEAFSSSSQVTTSTGEVSQTPPQPPLGGLDVDLNDTPQEFYQFFGFPEPGDHQEVGAGAGGAASKENNNSVI